ncbi:GAF domain-containing sensor histidine kinase [Prochlorothrix hollandica]|uniref:GAF domain-containing sensor histidine kinase n=1 Tax=Prochlorothrix hollandica TaxID=1223 RepID=UPI00034B8C49|nr:GAF domain-containing protein [Prochlorothrix hollandica]
MLDNRLFCPIDDRHAKSREQERLLVLANSGLLETQYIPVFEEALQTAAKILKMPFGWVGFMERNRLVLKAAIGLHRLGLMNPLASQRVVNRDDSFCTHVVDSLQALVLPDTHRHPAFIDALLTQEYGIRAYVGVPLLLSSGHCLGTLTLMDESVHQFNEHDIHILQMFARWCVSEIERDLVMRAQQHSDYQFTYAAMWQELEVTPPPFSESWAMLPVSHPPHPAMKTESVPNRTKELLPLQARLRLVHQLADQLTSPLTAILGMANILGRGIYGSINAKQQEYLNVIQDSGQTLRLWSQEILELAQVEDLNTPLQLLPLDLETLCEQVIHHVQDVMITVSASVQVSSEPGQRIWNLDRDKARKMLYNIIYGLLQTSETDDSKDSVLRLHMSQKQGQLRLTFWFDHPWLDDGSSALGLAPVPMGQGFHKAMGQGLGPLDKIALQRVEEEMEDVLPLYHNSTPKLDVHSDRPSQLRLLLCQYWTELQGGKLWIHESEESGLRYIISLPVAPTT